MDLDIEGTVVSPLGVVAPLSGTSACAVHVEAVRDGAVVGVAILGDLLRLRTDAGEVDLLVRRVAFAFTTRFDPVLPLRDPLAAELVPLLRHRPDGLRERCILPGDRFRLRGQASVPDGGSARSLVVDDRSTIRLDEVLSLMA